MKKLISGIALLLVLHCAVLLPQAYAEESEQPVVQRQTAIVLLGSSRYLDDEYLDILNRYFVKCYSQYRYPTEFGEETQLKFAAAYDAVAKYEADSKRDVREINLPAIVAKMDKEQVLFVDVRDVVRRSWRRVGWHFGTEDVWEASVEVRAVLVDRNGIVHEEKLRDWVDEQYSPNRALMEAYTTCIRKLQQRKIFP